MPCRPCVYGATACVRHRPRARPTHSVPVGGHPLGVRTPRPHRVGLGRHTAAPARFSRPPNGRWSLRPRRNCSCNLRRRACNWCERRDGARRGPSRAGRPFTPDIDRPADRIGPPFRTVGPVDRPFRPVGPAVQTGVRAVAPTSAHVKLVQRVGLSAVATVRRSEPSSTSAHAKLCAEGWGRRLLSRLCLNFEARAGAVQGGPSAVACAGGAAACIATVRRTSRARAAASSRRAVDRRNTQAGSRGRGGQPSGIAKTAKLPSLPGRCGDGPTP